MDRIIKTGIALFLIVLVLFTGWISYTGYVRSAFEESLVSTYSYSLSITTDTPLYNVTFFIPLPVNAGRSSPVVQQIGSPDIPDKPADWKFSIYGANNATMVKITAPVILPEGPSGISVQARSATPINTKNPADGAAVIQPKQDLSQGACSAIAGEKTASSVCYQYLGVIYADYTTDPNAKVLIRSSVTGKNRWHIFKPSSNEYRDSLALTLLGDDNHGWFPAKGELVTGTGDYDMPGF